MPRYIHRESHRTQRIGWLRAAVLGALAARTGGVPLLNGSLRVVFRGAPAMGLTAVADKLVDTVL